MLENLAAEVNADRALVRRGRWLTLTFVLGIDDDDYLVRIDRGAILEVQPRRLQTEVATFSIRASSSTWAEHWQRFPRRDFHDIWSMLPKGLARLEGDLLPLMQNLQYFKDVVASIRAKEALDANV